MVIYPKHGESPFKTIKRFTKQVEREGIHAEAREHPVLRETE